MRWLKDQGVWLLFKKATKCFPKPWCHFIPQPCPPHAHQHLVRSVYLVLSILGVLFNGCSVSTKWLCSVTQFCPTLWPHGLWAFLSVEFSRQEYWSRLPFPSSGDLPDPGIKPESPALAGGFLTTEPPGKPPSKFLGRHKFCESCSEYLYEITIGSCARVLSHFSRIWLSDAMVCRPPGSSVPVDL